MSGDGFGLLVIVAAVVMNFALLGACLVRSEAHDVEKCKAVMQSSLPNEIKAKALDVNGACRK